VIFRLNFGLQKVLGYFWRPLGPLSLNGSTKSLPDSFHAKVLRVIGGLLYELKPIGYGLINSSLKYSSFLSVRLLAVVCFSQYSTNFILFIHDELEKPDSL